MGMDFDKVNAVLYEARQLRSEAMRQLLARLGAGLKGLLARFVGPARPGAGKPGTPAAC
jgi:hypothetical protein